MKKIITICAAIFLTASVFAQAPDKMSYQAVIRDASNALVTSTAVGMQISILQGSASGTAVYVETQTPTTNVNGLASVEIGSGTLISGTFSTIDWANGPYFIKTETDPTGGTAYTITGTSQLMSVPYALYSESTGDTTMWRKNGNNIVYYPKFVAIGDIQNPANRLHIKDTTISHSLIIVDGKNTGLYLRSLGDPIGDMNTFTLINNGSGPFKHSLSLSNSDTNGVWTDHILRVDMDASNNSIVVGAGGNIGINMATPQRSLHVSDVLRLEPRTTSPTSPSKGDMYFDGVLNKLRVWDGTVWQNCW